MFIDNSRLYYTYTYLSNAKTQEASSVALTDYKVTSCSFLGLFRITIVGGDDIGHLGQSSSITEKKYKKGFQMVYNQLMESSSCSSQYLTRRSLHRLTEN
jgi:hypothetical protein